MSEELVSEDRGVDGASHTEPLTRGRCVDSCQLLHPPSRRYAHHRTGAMQAYIHQYPLKQFDTNIVEDVHGHANYCMMPSLSLLVVD